MNIEFSLKGEATAVSNFISLLKHLGKDVGPVAANVGHGAVAVEKVALGVASSPLASTILSAASPVLGPLVTTLAGAILHAQESHGTTSSPAIGEAKKNQVLQMIESASPILLELLVARTGHTVVDEAKFAQGIDDLIEGLVAIFQGIGTIPAKA